MSNYEPDYLCNCGHSFSTKHDERLDLFDSGGVLIGVGCPRCGNVVNKQNGRFL